MGCACTSTSISTNLESPSVDSMSDQGSTDVKPPSPRRSKITLSDQGSTDVKPPSPRRSKNTLSDQGSTDVKPPSPRRSKNTLSDQGSTDVKPPSPRRSKNTLSDQGSTDVKPPSPRRSKNTLSDQGSIDVKPPSPRQSKNTVSDQGSTDVKPPSPRQSKNTSVDGTSVDGMADESVVNQHVLPPPQELHRSTSATKHISLHKEVLSPLAKGVQSVPIFGLGPNQAKKFADAGYVKPHESKAELSLHNVISSKDDQENDAVENVEAIIKVSSYKKDQTSKEMAVVQEMSDASSSQEEEMEEEEESVLTVDMQSLSLSALDQQTSSKDNEETNSSNKALARSATLSDTSLLVVEKKSKTTGKTQSKSLSFLKLSSTSLKILAMKSCITGGINHDSSSDEAVSYKSSLDETANGRSDKESMSKRKKKQKKKKKWMMRKSESTVKGTGKSSETQQQDNQVQQKSDPSIHSIPPDVSKEPVPMVTGNKSLEWDHYGDSILSSSLAETISDISLKKEEFTKSPANIQYHKDILDIFKQVEKEGGPKLNEKAPAEIDEDKLGLQITILHLHRKKEDIQKVLKVTQEHLWESERDVENLQTQLGEMGIHNQNINMERMMMEEKLCRSALQLLQVRTELGTKITILEREIERLEKRLQQHDDIAPDAPVAIQTDKAVQTEVPPHQKPYKQNGIKAEMEVLKCQNSQLHKKLSHLTEEHEKQRLISQSVTQFTEYLKFKLLNLEEKLITEKQQTQLLTKMISSTNSKPVTHNGPDTSASICKAGSELGIPEDDDPIVQVKSHMAWIQKIMDAIAMETGRLKETIKINLEESRLEKCNLQAEIASLKSEHKQSLTQLSVNQAAEVERLHVHCQQLCEDNNQLEEICVQHAKEMSQEKEKAVKVAKDDMANQQSYGQLIVEHLHREDALKQQLLLTQQECNQAKKDVQGRLHLQFTDKIQQISTLQKKCSELITTEHLLRKELEHTKEDSQHAIEKLQENQSLAITSLQHQRFKLDSDKQEHEAELTEVKRALQQVCDSLKETVQQNMELIRQRESLEMEKKEKDNALKEMELAMSETKMHFKESWTCLQQSKEETKALQKQCLLAENENKQQSTQMKMEMDRMKADNQHHLTQLQHNKRLVEELQQMVKKQEKQHDEVLEELLQRNVEHEHAVEQVHESTKCIQELQQQYTQMNAEKEHLKGGMEVQVQRLLSENQQVKTQLQDSQHLVKAQHSKCQKLSQDLKSATCELTKRDHTIESLRQELAVSTATQKKEFETIFEENTIARADLEARLCRTECSATELRASEHSLKVQLAVQMETVRLLEEERSKNAGLEQKLQAMENQLRENNKSIELSSSTSLHQASEIKMLSDAVNATKNQLKELIENKMHTALLSQLQEKQGLTNQLMEALSVIDNYDQCYKQDDEVKQVLSLTNQNLQEQCDSLTSLYEEEQQKHRNTASRLEEISEKLATESREKLMLLQEKEKLYNWNKSIFNQAGSLTSSLTSISTGQSSELLQLKESSGRLASDIQLVLRLPSNGINSKENNSEKIGSWANSFGILNANIGYQQS